MSRHAARDAAADPFDRRRQRMLRRHIAGRGIEDPRVVDAMASVRRERFVARALAWAAYNDGPLPIGAGQTISQPFIVALMAEAAEVGPDDRVLEVGTGSGYGAAVLRCLAGEVWTIERHHSLAVKARKHLVAEGFDDVHVLEGDGTLGWAEAAPFDAIVVTAGGPAVPHALQAQLAAGGRLIMPVGPTGATQFLVRLRRTGDDLTTENLGPVRFVPLVGGDRRG